MKSVDFQRYVNVAEEVADALRDGRPVVALESTIISHGLPWPENLACAENLERVIRGSGAVPATIAILGGRISIGLNDQQLRHLAQGNAIAKVSRRDLAGLVSRNGDGATTVAATMICAALAGIRVFATGGIGGVHRGADRNFDISADLTELSRTPVAVVCAGVKSILDLPKTLELLETFGVPVIGFTTDELPAFYTRSSGLQLPDRAESASEVARLLATRDALGLGGGELITVPIPAAAALPPALVDQWIADALREADRAGILGKAITPFLLQRIAQMSEGKTLEANLALVENNTRVASEIAVALAALKSH